MYVCMNVCMYVCMYVCVCIQMVGHTSAAILQIFIKNGVIVERLSLPCHKSHYTPRINRGSKVRINKLQG